MDFRIPDYLQKLQDQLLEALTQFDRIATLADCRYSLMCGTLLGAIRHQGFIPWDDDVDVVMYRNEYEKFREFCLTSVDMGKAYLDEKDTWVPRIRIDDSKSVFVDIFILDNLPPAESIRKRTIFQLKILQGMMKKDIKYSNYSIKNKVLILATHIAGLPFQFDCKYKKYHAIATKYKHVDSGKYYIADGAFAVTNIIWDKDEFNEFIRVPFQGHGFLITTSYESVLTKLYGQTYMQLPPEKDRIPKHNS